MFLLETIQRESVIRFPFLGNLTLNPPASFSVFGREIYFYGVIIALGFILGILYCARRAPEFGIRSDDIYDMMIWMIPLSILGARLYFVLFQAEYYLAHPAEIFAVWEGGLAIYGGIISGVLIGQALGRWGNFFNREAFGAETEIFCRMGLTAPDGTTVYVHPTFLYESLWNLVGLLFLVRFSKSGRRRYNGQIALMYFFWYGLGRSWIEGLRSDSLYLAHTGIRVSQLLSILILCVSATILFINRNKKTAVGPVSGEPDPEAESEGRI